MAIGKNTPGLSLDIEVTKRYDGIQVKKKGASNYAYKAASDNGGGYINLLDKDGVRQFGLYSNEKKMIIGSEELTEKQLRIMKMMHRPIWHFYTSGKYPSGPRLYIYLNTVHFVNTKLRVSENFSNASIKGKGNGGFNPQFEINMSPQGHSPMNFEIEKIKAGIYVIRHDATDSYLSADPNGKGAVSLIKTKNSKRQHMNFIANENGSFLIKNIHSDWYVRSSGGGLSMSIATTPWFIAPGELDMHTFLRAL